MTVATPEGGGSAVVPYDENFANLGLEDVEASDLVLPRINIDHDKGVFVNSLTQQEFPALTAVFLGMVKQRIMWPEKLDDGDKPRCKSPDFIHGFPRISDTVPYSKKFPFDESNFNEAQAQPVYEEPSQQHPEGWSSNGHAVLPCASCKFKEWGKDRDNKSVPPLCSEQHTYPILYMVQEVHEDGTPGEISWVPAIFTVARSGIKNSRAFINSFAQSKQPFFTVYTGLTLQGESRGKNDYYVPVFKRMTPTDRNSWVDYGNQLRGIREMLRGAPRPSENEDTAPDSVTNVNTGPAPVVAEVVTPPAAPAAPPAPAPAPPVAPPVAEAPAQHAAPEAPPAPPAPPAAPTPPPAAEAPAAPPMPAAPPAPPAAPADQAAPPAPPAAPATPAAPPAPPAAPGGGGDLPF